MDAEERSRLRKDLWLYHQAPDGTPKRRSGREFVSRIPQLLGALDAAEAEAARYREALEDTARRLDRMLWARDYAESVYLILVGIRDGCRAALAATEPEGSDGSG